MQVKHFFYTFELYFNNKIYFYLFIIVILVYEKLLLFNPKYAYTTDSELVPWGKDERVPLRGIEKLLKLSANKQFLTFT